MKKYGNCCLIQPQTFHWFVFACYLWNNKRIWPRIYFSFKLFDQRRRPQNSRSQFWAKHFSWIHFQKSGKQKEKNVYKSASTLQWRHNEHGGVSNYQHLVCLLNRLFRRRSKKTSNLRVTGLCEGNSPVTASNADIVFIWWRHHVCHRFTIFTSRYVFPMVINLYTLLTKSLFFNKGFKSKYGCQSWLKIVATKLFVSYCQLFSSFPWPKRWVHYTAFVLMIWISEYIPWYMCIQLLVHTPNIMMSGCGYSTHSSICKSTIVTHWCVIQWTPVMNEWMNDINMTPP